MIFSAAYWSDIRVCLCLSALLTATSLATPGYTQSLIIPDNTLVEDEQSVILPGNDSIPGERIINGAQRGQNLFHSFEEFNVDAGRGAYFIIENNNIQNIFSRITGNQTSNILGFLGTRRFEGGNFLQTNANLYLINPNGILFGPNASLDLGGSFFVTTSDAVQFGGQGSFSATNPTAPSQLLKINPSAFFFGASPGTITNQSFARSSIDSSFTPSFSEGLRVLDGQNIVLLGGNVNLEGGKLTALDGHVQIGSVISNGVVELDLQENLVIFPSDVSRGNVTLSNNGIVNVEGQKGGSIDIFAQDINLLNRSEFISRIVEGSNASDTQAGDITLDATGQILIEQRSTIANNVQANAIGNGGDIKVSANSLIINGFGSAITNSSFGTGNAGNIIINAETISIDQGELFSRIPEEGNGNSGTIEINAEDVLLSEAFITTANRGNGNGGDITLNVGSLSANQGSNLTASVFGVGNSGNITIDGRETVSFEGFRINNSGGTLRTAVFTNIENNGNGQAGDIRVTANSISLSNQAALFSNIRQEGSGVGGDIYIEGNTLSVSDGAELRANVLGQGVAGNIFIDITGDVFFQGGDAFTNVGPDAIESTGGNIEITAHNLYVTKSGQITTAVFSQGNAGNITIDADNSVMLDGISDSFFGTGIFSSFRNLGEIGQSGNINISANDVLVTNGAQLITTSAGIGESGDITIDARDSVIFTGGRNVDQGSGVIEFEASGAISRVQNQGIKGGDIFITAGSLNIENGAALDAETILGSQGNAGNINISVDNTVVVDGVAPTGSSSKITSASTAFGLGAGGNIDISADTVRVSNGGVITSQTDILGTGGGSININAASFEALNGGQLLTDTNGSGEAGKITLNIQQKIDIVGQDPNFEQRSGLSIDTEGANSGLFASTTDLSSGNGGAISLQAPIILLRDNGTVSAQSDGSGTAGSITLEASDELRLNNGDMITAATNASGGDILINVSPDNNSGFLILEGDSDITTNSRGDGGNITIGRVIIAFDDSDILARSQDANGGNIALGVFFSETLPPDNQEPFDGDGRVDINADGQLASGTISTPDTSFIENSLNELPEALINPEALVANSCIVRSQETGSTFIITGDSLAQRPTDIPVSTYSTGTVETVAEAARVSASNWQLGDPIIEPEAVYRLADGRLVMSRDCK